MSDDPKIGTTRATADEVARETGVHPIDDLGIGEAAEPTEEDIVICMPAIWGVHTATSHEETCSECQRAIWVAATTSPRPRRVCVPCSAVLMDTFKVDPS